MRQESAEITAGLVKAAPGIGFSGSVFLGLTPPEWATVLTIVYMASLLGFLYWEKTIKPWRQRRWNAKVAAAALARHESGRGPRQ
jgi:hypothetical protein